MGVLGGLTNVAVGAASGAMMGGGAGAAVGAALGLVRTFTSAIIDAVKQMQANFGKLRETILDTVAAFRPFAIVQFTRALQDLKAVFGSIFLPILQQATDLIRTFANYIYGLPRPLRDAIQAIVKANLLTGAALTLGSALSALGIMLAPVHALMSGLKYLANLFTSTAGGASATRSALSMIEGGLAALTGVLQAAWNRTADARAKLGKAFDELGSAMNKLFEALKPILAAELAGLGIAFELTVRYYTFMIRTVASAITHLTEKLTRLLSPLSKLIGLAGFSLPDMSRGKKDAFGLGWGGANVTDASSLYNRLTEEVLRNSRPATPEEKMPEVVSHMDQVLTRMEQAIVQPIIQVGLAAQFYISSIQTAGGGLMMGMTGGLPLMLRP